MNLQPIDAALAASAIRVPGPLDDKYSRGVVGLVTGSDLYPGAGLLSTAGAILSGAGLVRYLGVAKRLVLGRFPEVVLQPGRVQAGVVGCGWGEDLLPVALNLAMQEIPIVVDAGALNVTELAERADVITPHHGEAARVLGVGRAEVDADPLGAARELERRLGAVVVLKSATTLVVSGDRAWYYQPTSHWGATAGAGDVLAGVIGAMVAQGQVDLGPAVAAGVYVHGQAATRCPGPITASDIAAGLRSVLVDLLAERSRS